MADTSYPQTTPLALATSSGLTEGYGASQGSSLSTGDLRRRYDFSDRFSELAIDQTPFFRFVSKVAKKPTDDPSFKFTEKRQSIMKRYAYAVGQVIVGDAEKCDDASFRAFNKATGSAANETIEVGDTVKVFMATDYESAGNIQNVHNQSSGAIKIGAAGTAPEFFMPNQIVQIPLASAGNGSPTAVDYCLIRVTAVGAEVDKASLASTASVLKCKLVTGTVIRAASGALTSFSGNDPVVDVYNKEISGTLEEMRCHVVGNSYEEGSSLLGKTWKDNPYSTGYGQTQIFRTEFGMTNTARATVLKYEPNEWARVWRDKLIEHKWDIEQAGIFGTQTGASIDPKHTQGAVDYILGYGNQFSLDTATKTVDNFLDDMSKYLDPRYNNSKASVYFCSTEVYNWLHKVGGYFSNNMGLEGQLNYDMAIAGRKSVFGLDTTVISTVYGDMNLVRCIALDRSHVKMMGINMNHVKYRPLVGNGINRDTSVYVGVQTLENTGTDKRVDMILTEAGFEWQMPETHAIWT